MPTKPAGTQRTAVVRGWVTPGERDALLVIAEQDGRTVSQLIRRLVQRAIEESGFTPEYGE